MEPFQPYTYNTQPISVSLGKVPIKTLLPETKPPPLLRKETLGKMMVTSSISAAVAGGLFLL